jgi:hypothetical protein
MNLPAFTLVREPGSDRCAKCDQNAQGSRTPIRHPAVYSLRRGQQAWRLCVSHAAHAAHVHKIESAFVSSPANAKEADSYAI